MKTNKLVFIILTTVSLLMVVVTAIGLIVTCTIHPERIGMVVSSLKDNLLLFIFEFLLLGFLPISNLIYKVKKDGYLYDNSIDYFSTGVCLFVWATCSLSHILNDAKILNEDLTDTLLSICFIVAFVLAILLFIRLFRPFICPNKKWPKK
ncbi:MAG: hypothetical protein MJZ42_01280 [Bacteroidales bacterium]|nr:hypothetical protein [Bacteroidales bacterium]